MPLAQTIIDQIRDEIGIDEDVTDALTTPGPLGSLEDIYTNEDRGNYSILTTAYIVWKRRLGAIQSRSFDATAGGSLLSRRQRVKFIQQRIKELEPFVDFTLKGVNESVNSDYQRFADTESEYA